MDRTLGILLLLLALALGLAASVSVNEYKSCSDVPSACRSHLCDSTRAKSRLWSRYAGIDIMTHGIGSPLPTSENRYSTGFLINGTYFLIDAGTGVARDLGNYKCEDWTVKLKYMGLTHFHSDHIGDVGFLLNIGFVNGRRGPAAAVQLYGPEGLSALASAWRALYAADAYSRQTVYYPSNQTCSHVADPATADSLNFASHEFWVNSTDSLVPLFSVNGVNVTAMIVPHVSIYPAVGYILQSKDIKIVVSGDTTPSTMVETQAADADYLIHEVLNATWTQLQFAEYVATNNSKAGSFWCNVPGAHTPIEALAGIAQRARVKNLVVTHQVPIMDPEALYQAVRDAGFTYGNLYAAADGDYWKVLKD